MDMNTENADVSEQATIFNQNLSNKPHSSATKLRYKNVRLKQQMSAPTYIRFNKISKQ